jgi:predicted NAD/FAD-binding protein
LFYRVWSDLGTPQNRLNLTNISWGFSPVVTPRITCRTDQFALVADLKLPEQPPYLAACHGGQKKQVAVVGTGISSFAVTADTGRFEWKGGGNNWFETARGLFAQPGNMLSPSYLWMLRDIITFNQQCTEDSAAGKLAGLTLGEYFRTRHFAPRLLTDYLAPMGAAIWSAPSSEMLDFPAENFVAFFANHRLLQYDRPVWRTVRAAAARPTPTIMS